MKVLLWRWRWLMAWELTVFREMYTLRIKGTEMVCFTESDGDWFREDDNLQQTLVRGLRYSEIHKGDKVEGKLWRALCGDRAGIYYREFAHEVWVYWYVYLNGAWWRRFTPEGRRNI